MGYQLEKCNFNLEIRVGELVRYVPAKRAVLLTLQYDAIEETEVVYQLLELRSSVLKSYMIDRLFFLEFSLILLKT